MTDLDALLQDIWYFALPRAQLRPGRLTPRLLLGQPVVFGIDGAGIPFALRDICPHRGIPLSAGRFDGHELECAYHGWRFGTDGRCRAIPSLVEGQDFDVAKIGVRRYPVRCVQGNVWIWMGEREPDREPPRIPHFADDRGADLIEVQDYPCHVDHAAVGLLDPAHGPYVHRSWFWRSKRSMHDKAKAFGPSELGFAMLRHRPSRNSAPYKLLGGVPETEIRFQLPGIRIEHIQAGANHVVNMTTVTPVDRERTQVTNQLYWTLGWASLLKPLLRPFARTFLRQDRDIVALQAKGLRHNPPLMLIKDADTQARWYFQLKAEWQRARAENRTFENPVRETTLRWRT